MIFNFLSKIRSLSVLLLLLSGCGFVYSVSSEDDLLIQLPEAYVSPTQSENAHDLSKPWWQSYNDPHLNELITKALQSNLSLKAAWERMLQVKAQREGIESGIYPSVNVTGSGARSFTKNTSTANDSNDEVTTRDAFNNFSAGAAISYQVDLWNRTRSSLKSGEFLEEASKQDAENTALILSGTIAQYYVRAQELKATMRLLREQIAASNRMLKITKHRFSLGQSSALDVYQQQLQLTSIKGEVPLVRTELKQTLNNLAVLTGEAPGSIRLKRFSGVLPTLPPLPNIGSPKTLMDARPDLRAWRSRLASSKYDIASAFADKFPSIDLSLSYNFSAQRISDLLTNQVAQIVSSIVQPIIDGGRRDAVIDEREAYMKGVQLEFNNNILTALRDIENAILEEKGQLLYLENVQKQLDFAEATLRESRKRYLSGAIDYLQVTVALQSLQTLQRNKIASQARVINARNQLYLALGGTWTDGLTYSRGKS